MRVQQRYRKITLSVLVTISVLVGLLAGLSTYTQAVTTETPENTLTATSRPTVHRAPCDGEATRTPTATATITPTLDLRSPTPTQTPTSDSGPLHVALIYPPNCAVLHSPVLPSFEFQFQGGAFVHTVSVFSLDRTFSF